ncbi:MAG: OsmC family protein [Rhodanobacteraceae bacterium]
MSARLQSRQSRVAARQDPLRRHYRDHPEDALITGRGRSHSTDLADPLHIWAEAGSREYGQRWKLGLHKAVAGEHDAPNPGDLLCQALASCMDSVLRMLAERHGIELESLQVDATGDVNVRGTLQVTRGVPVGFQQLRCHVRMLPRGAVPVVLMERLVTAAEQSCVNLATLRGGVPVELRWNSGE